MVKRPTNWAVCKLALYMVFVLPVVCVLVLKLAAALTGVGGIVLALLLVGLLTYCVCYTLGVV